MNQIPGSRSWHYCLFELVMLFPFTDYKVVAKGVMFKTNSVDDETFVSKGLFTYTEPLSSAEHVWTISSMA